jgi:hypothetical protein
MITITSLSGNQNELTGAYEEIHGVLSLDDGTAKTFALQRSSTDKSKAFDDIVDGINRQISNSE